jgi:GTP-binding protein EngB required for normal cell division
MGKSSFINQLSGQALVPVGQNDGLSCTTHVTALTFRDSLNVFGANAQVRCLDVPGFNDTTGAMSNKKIIEEVKLGTAGLSARVLDALFLFQSSADSNIQLQKCLQLAETLFGPTILRSTVVIATKSDLLPQSVLTKHAQTIDTISRAKGVQVVWWVNDSEDNGPVEDAKKRMQAAQLQATLSQLRPYEITDIQRFECLVQARAEQMVREDQSNVVQQQNIIPYDVVVAYQESETYTVPVLQRQYTDAQVNAEATRLQALQSNKEPYQVSRQILETVTEPEAYTDYETVRHYRHVGFIRWRESEQVPVQRVRQVQRQQYRTITEVAYRDRPFEQFAAPLRQQMVTVSEQRVRQVQRQRSERRTRTETVTSYRRDWTQYRLQAAKELIARQALVS